ncbi:hypothetical protein [Vibrio gallicus]|uniref:hypothetical protein n=1 Tax=Vibrio gallicus TaxID=190897 RepID=UPI0021C36DEB|nr:hypothetical protein [Vibrio gallicus]
MKATLTLLLTSLFITPVALATDISPINSATDYNWQDPSNKTGGGYAWQDPSEKTGGGYAWQDPSEKTGGGYI